MSDSPPTPLFWTVTGRDFGRAIAWAKSRPNELAVKIRVGLRQRACRHQFRLDDIKQTGIPIPPPPPCDAGYEVHCDYLEGLWQHPSHTQRVEWPCAKCGKIFFEHCGLDVLAKHGRIAPQAEGGA